MPERPQRPQPPTLLSVERRPLAWYDQLTGVRAMSVAQRSQRDAIRDLLADLKMPGSLEAVDGILSEIDGGRLAPGRRTCAVSRRRIARAQHTAVDLAQDAVDGFPASRHLQVGEQVADGVALERWATLIARPRSVGHTRRAGVARRSAASAVGAAAAARACCSPRPRPVRARRQGPQQPTLVAFEARPRHLGRGPMQARVRRLRQPRQRLGIEIVVVEEAPPVEEALTDVADGPLDLPLVLARYGRQARMRKSSAPRTA